MSSNFFKVIATLLLLICLQWKRDFVCGYASPSILEFHILSLTENELLSYSFELQTFSNIIATIFGLVFTINVSKGQLVYKFIIFHNNVINRLAFWLKFGKVISPCPVLLSNDKQCGQLVAIERGQSVNNRTYQFCTKHVREYTMEHQAYHITDKKYGRGWPEHFQKLKNESVQLNFAALKELALDCYTELIARRDFAKKFRLGYDQGHVKWERTLTAHMNFCYKIHYGILHFKSNPDELWCDYFDEINYRQREEDESNIYIEELVAPLPQGVYVPETDWDEMAAAARCL